MKYRTAVVIESYSICGGKCTESTVLRIVNAFASINQMKGYNVMNEYKIPIKTIFSQRLAGYLMMRGFVLIDIRKNENGSGKNVFYFKDSIELSAAMKEYFILMKKH